MSLERKVFGQTLKQQTKCFLSGKRAKAVLNESPPWRCLNTCLDAFCRKWCPLEGESIPSVWIFPSNLNFLIQG